MRAFLLYFVFVQVYCTYMRLLACTYLAAVESGFEEFPTGRTTVRGFIRSYKWKDDRFGGSTLKITLVDER
ncbi:MAG: hypothetical protein GY774_39125, partial [Planctomycetes bacterium]|nr:hypothetical protein [Planctomycetota bacterium]